MCTPTAAAAVYWPHWNKCGMTEANLQTEAGPHIETTTDQDPGLNLPPHATQEASDRTKGAPSPPTEGGQGPQGDTPDPQDRVGARRESPARVFAPKQQWCAQSVLRGMKSAHTAPHATSQHYGTDLNPPTAPGTSRDVWSTEMDRSYAGASSTPGDAQASSTVMNAQGVGTQTMEPMNVLAANELWDRQ
ncbi:hypothetical protein ID866_10119 [Astraeus odoratus]|nr:hypothetical protein ID866_10119 [Astraeus odoratus]